MPVVRSLGRAEETAEEPWVLPWGFLTLESRKMSIDVIETHLKRQR